MADEAAEVPEDDAFVVTTETTADNAGVSEESVPASPPPASEAPAESSPAATAAPLDVFALAKQHAGYDYSTKYKTPEEFFKGVANLHSLAGRKSEKERLAEQVAPHLNEFVAWRQQQLQALSRPPEQPQVQPLFAEPQLADGDEDWIENDPDNPGRRRIARDAPTDVKKRLLDRVRFEENLRRNPANVFAPALDRVRQEAVEEAKRQALAEMQTMLYQQQAAWQEQQARQQIVSARQAQVVQMQDGRPVIDASTGMPVLTDYGRAYAERESRLFQNGITAEGLRDSLAHEYAAAKVAEGLNKPAPKKTPGATKAQDATGGRTVNGERTHGKRASLAQMIREDNPDVKDDDVVASLSFK